MSSNYAFNTQWIPPDGGWGWMIVVAYAMCNIVNTACAGNFGLVFANKFTIMNLSATDITLIANVNAAFAMSMGLFSGALLRRFTYRKVGLLAGCLVAIGMTATAFASTFVEFLLFYGIVAAAGFGLSIAAFSLALNSYFLEKRNKAVGISMTLTGLGPIFFPYLISVWLVEFGVTGCVMLLGALSLHIIVAALLLHPVKWYHRKRAVDVELEALSEKGSTAKTVEACNRSYCDVETDHRHRKILNADNCVDAQSIYGIDQLSFVRNPSYVERSIVNNLSSAKADPKSQLPKLSINRDNPRFQRSISHVLQRRLSHNPESPLPSPTLSKPQLRWFEAASSDTVNLGSSVDVFSEDARRVSTPTVKPDISATLPKLPLQTVNERTVISKPESVLNATYPKPTNWSFFKWLIDFFDLTLFRDLVYVNILIGMSLAIFAELNFSILTPFIFNDLAYTTPQIASFLSVIALADIASRFGAPFLGDRLHQTPRIMYMLSMVMLIAARMMVLLVSSYRSMLIVCIALGISKGVRTVYMQLVIPSHVPLERLASAAGLQMVCNGFVMITLGPVVGVIRDWTGSYSNCILFINVITCFPLVMWSTEMIIQRTKNTKQDKLESHQRTKNTKQDKMESQQTEILKNLVS